MFAPDDAQVWNSVSKQKIKPYNGRKAQLNIYKKQGGEGK